MDLKHEELSLIVSKVLGASGHITVANAEEMVSAYSYEPAEILEPIWNRAIAVASAAAPWLNDAGAAQSDWSMNLFTPTGLWCFPNPEQDAE